MKRILLLLSLLLVFTTPAFAEFSGKVVGVTDGDTISVLWNYKEVKVRLEAIDCPELGQGFGAKAKKVCSDYCFGKTVIVKSTGTDKYGRTLGYVILPDGRSLNEALVYDGYAWWYKKYAPAHTKMQQLEASARSAGRGLWSQKNPIPPWEHRRSVASTAPESASETVHITRTGEKYHRAGCRYLARSDIPIARSDAVARGYTPCSVCRP